MSKPYFIVAALHTDSPQHWGIHFGAYDRDDCKDEIDDISDNDDVIATKLIRCADDSQATIDAEIDRLNEMMTGKTRTIEPDDLWSAVRGLGLHSKTADELQALIDHHGQSEMFASKVIAEAAQQVLNGGIYAK